MVMVVAVVAVMGAVVGSVVLWTVVLGAMMIGIMSQADSRVTGGVGASVVGGVGFVTTMVVLGIGTGLGSNQECQEHNGDSGFECWADH
ncbi:uncharacterized protein BJ171DRAFT_489617 [Polychytrium aggregatum]|uniref:uncharacterized protein n=1 Tax=Polychytrium aggregatum TaxID=110093 RepID=UPI0022FEDDE1|nr:uncharacterized protein BJ171DRAFT_489617 [Polychytrium aggregatum]KAI9208669.1 hypothetical protein BJ171DRAFT_489617 [Polychytrium aggregatum]